MAHLRAYRAAADGKPPASNTNPTTAKFPVVRRVLIAFAALFLASLCGSASYAQSGPFAGMAGNWSGGGTITLDDGSTERIRCRASYALGAGGSGLNLSLVCASDSYKFDLRANVIAQGGALSGSWSETSRNVNGTLEGRGGNGTFQVLANAAGFAASISLTTRGNRQSINITGEGSFRGASLTLSRV